MKERETVLQDNKLTEGTPIRSAGDGLALGNVLRQLAWPMLVTYALLPVAFLFPILDSTREPYCDLTSGVANVFYWTTQSGGISGAPIIGVLMLVLLITRHGMSGARRTLEAALIVIVVAIFAGGGAALNENGVKEALKVPRPNIVYLGGADGAGPLGMSPEEFYGKGDKEARSELLRKTLGTEPPPVELRPAIRDHWIEETGYSFPSGHAFAAMFFATFFLATGVAYISTPRRRLFYLLLPWAVAVCCSRLILRVHTPADVVVGSLEGLVLGFVAFLLFRAALTAGYKGYNRLGPRK